MAVKLRKSHAPAPDAPAATNEPVTQTLRPLEVSGVCLTKQALIEGLRIYIPTLIDIQEFEGGDKYLLTVAPTAHPEPTT